MSRFPNPRSAGRRGHGSRLETGSFVVITALLFACGPTVDRPSDAPARAPAETSAPSGSGAVTLPADSTLPDRREGDETIAEHVHRPGPDGEMLSRIRVTRITFSYYVD